MIACFYKWYGAIFWVLAWIILVTIQARWKLPLDGSVRYYTTFVTLNGLIRFKKLLFGLSCSAHPGLNSRERGFEELTSQWIKRSRNTTRPKLFPWSNNWRKRDQKYPDQLAAEYNFISSTSVREAFCHGCNFVETNNLLSNFHRMCTAVHYPL